MGRSRNGLGIRTAQFILSNEGLEAEGRMLAAGSELIDGSLANKLKAGSLYLWIPSQFSGQSSKATQ